MKGESEADPLALARFARIKALGKFQEACWIHDAGGPVKDVKKAFDNLLKAQEGVSSLIETSDDVDTHNKKTCDQCGKDTGSEDRAEVSRGMVR